MEGKKSFPIFKYLLLAAGILIAFQTGRLTAPPELYPRIVPTDRTMSMRITRYINGVADSCRRVPITHVYALSSYFEPGRPDDAFSEGQFDEEPLYVVEFAECYFENTGSCEGLIYTIKVGKSQLDYNGRLRATGQEYTDAVREYLEGLYTDFEQFELPAHA